MVWCCSVCAQYALVFEKTSVPKVGDVVGCLLDIDGAAGTASMSFTLNGKSMGVAFDGVKLSPAAERGVDAAIIGGQMKVGRARQNPAEEGGGERIG